MMYRYLQDTILNMVDPKSIRLWASLSVVFYGVVNK